MDCLCCNIVDRLQYESVLLHFCLSKVVKVLLFDYLYKDAFWCLFGEKARAVSY